ncbi:MAG: potassium channel family protein [Verrucomicrobiales bacterium]
MLRAFKLARHPLALDHRQRALDIARPEVTLFGIVTAIILYLSSVGIYFFDNAAQPDVVASVFHSLWWAMVTLTTVGYGDAGPPTAGGRILTGFVLILGMGIVALPAGIFTAALSRARSEQENGELDERGSTSAKSEHSMA